MRSPRYQWWALVALLSGLLALNITFTVFVVALPTVKADFHTNLSVLAWVSTGPLLAFGVAAPFFGKVGDLFGHRRLYQFGLLGAMVSAVLTALAPSVGLLLFARALDGVQGAATGTASMAIILELFDREDRVKALGWWSLVGAGGPVLGVTLGSPVIQYFGWRTLFWGQLVLLVIASVVVAVLLPTAAASDGAAAADGAASRAGARTSGRAWTGWAAGAWPAAVTAGMLVLSLGPVVGWNSVAVYAGRRRRRRARRRLRVARDHLRHAAGADQVLAPAQLHVPDGDEDASRASPTSGASSSSRCSWSRSTATACRRSGFISVARPLLFAISAPIAGYMTVRTGERTATLIGTGSLFVSMLLFATLRPYGRADHHPASPWPCPVSAWGSRNRPPPRPCRTSSRSPSTASMSAAQLLATQVGEVAGIQAVLTIQESIAKNSGLGVRAPEHGAVAQLQRALLGGRVRGRPGRGERAVHPLPAAAGAAGASWRRTSPDAPVRRATR